MNGMRSFSLTGKIVLLVILNLALLSLVLAGFLQMQLRGDLESLLLVTTRERVLAVSRLLALELRDTPPDLRDEVLARYSDEYGVTFLLYNNHQERLAGPHLKLPDAVAERLRVPRGPFSGANNPEEAQGTFSFRVPGRPFLVVTSGPLRYWVGVRLPLHEDNAQRPIRANLLLASSRLFGNTFFFDWRPWLAIAGIAVAVSLLCWLPMVRGLTCSIRQMMQATTQISEGHFDVQVVAKRRDELGCLGASINRMSSRLASYVHGQKRFLGDIAHELRSPLARMQVALGILERRCTPESAGYIGDLQEDVETMSELTGELMTFAKAESRPDSVQLEPIDLAGVVREAADVERVEGVEIRVQIDPNLRVLGTKEYLLRSVANLLRNAIRYAGSAGPITVSSRREGEEVLVSVADSGPGVPEETVEKIFTPFYRLESSRDRRSGGTGLGLAIVRSCVEACHGSVECRNRKPSGLEVLVKLRAA